MSALASDLPHNWRCRHCGGTVFRTDAVCAKCGSLRENTFPQEGTPTPTWRPGTPVTTASGRVIGGTRYAQESPWEESLAVLVCAVLAILTVIGAGLIAHNWEPDRVTIGFNTVDGPTPWWVDHWFIWGVGSAVFWVMVARIWVFIVRVEDHLKHGG